jgi:hypothetical protein
LLFPSSEHAWQALHAADVGTFQLFTQGGPFATLTAITLNSVSARPRSNLKSVQKRVDFYSRDGVVMVGVVAQLATTNGHCALRALDLPSETAAAVWHDILVAKFEQHEAARRVLLSTGDHRLVAVTSTQQVSEEMGAPLERVRDQLNKKRAREEEEEGVRLKKQRLY